MYRSEIWNPYQKTQSDRFEPVSREFIKFMTYQCGYCMPYNHQDYSRIYARSHISTLIYA